MDFDLEIINEEGDCPNHLFESIMNAMNSMKEATADKIYQKIQKDGETNYSKPQVDKALENALKYGIFEVKNNRYRMRDDILDNEDTVYWKLHEKTERTPFRIQEGTSEKQFGLKLDPERDNQRFRKIESTEMRECPHCGRTKILEKKKKKMHKKSERLQKTLKRKRNNKKPAEKTKDSNTDDELNRKSVRDQNGKKLPVKKKETKKQSEESACPASDALLEDFWTETKELREKDSFDSTYSNINLLKTPDHSLESSTKHDKNNVNKQKKRYRSQYQCDREKTSSLLIKAEAEDETSNINFATEDQSSSKTWDSLLDSFPCTSRNGNGKARNQYLRSSEVYHNQYNNSQTDQHKGKSDYLGHPDEPQGTIIQSNNVLTIEPMDSLAFKSPEQASYIS